MPEPAENEVQAQAKPASRWWAWLKPSPKQISVAVALCLVAMAVVIQIDTRRGVDPYTAMRRDDLIALLDGLTNETDRLATEVNELEITRDGLKSGVDAQEVAKAEAQRRRDGLEILAGTVPAVGPGVRIVISANAGAISADLILDAIQELRDAGAEVIEVNDQVRLVAQSWVKKDGDQLIIDGHPISLPIVIEAIGEPHALAEGTRFRGGLVSQIESDKVKGSAQVVESDHIEITSLHQAGSLQYAHPA